MMPTTSGTVGRHSTTELQRQLDISTVTAVRNFTHPTVNYVTTFQCIGVIFTGICQMCKNFENRRCVKLPVLTEWVVALYHLFGGNTME